MMILKLSELFVEIGTGVFSEVKLPLDRYDELGLDEESKRALVLDCNYLDACGGVTMRHAADSYLSSDSNDILGPLSEPTSRGETISSKQSTIGWANMSSFQVD